MQKDIDFKFFKVANNKKPKLKNEITTIFLGLTFSMVVLFGGGIHLVSKSDKSVASGIQAVATFVDENAMTLEDKSENIQLNLLRYANVKVVSLKDGIALTIDTESLLYNNRFKEIVSQLKEKNFKVIDVKEITNFDNGVKETQLTLKKE